MVSRVLLVLAASVGAGGMAHALTATNVVATSQAGSGSAAISGYTISAVSYTMNSTTPTNLDSVAFTISPATGTVKAKLSAAGAWYACTNTAGAVACTTTSPQATVAGTDTLTVVAAE
jgi:hypothetical protein